MALAPLSYHQAIADHLAKHERGLWAWFSSDDFSKKHASSLKLELLKSTYRLDPEEHQTIYRLAHQAMQALEIDLPLTIYQSESASGSPNAALYYMKDELVVLLMGTVSELLNEEEMLALLGHELAHHKLYSVENERYFTAARLLDWCSGQRTCAASFAETQRLYQLYTEVYADLGALEATGNRDAVISCLVKVATGMKKVSTAAYLKQADEVLDQIRAGSEGVSHPETFIRAKFLEKAEHQPDDWAQLAALIEGELDAKRLDVRGQITLTEMTHKLIETFVADEAGRADEVLALARRYFPKFDWSDQPMERAKALAQAKEFGRALGDCGVLGSRGAGVRIYLSFVLLDLAACDPDGGDVALGWSLLLSEQAGFLKNYEPLARKELKRKKADLLKLAAQAASEKEKAASEG